jgi:hypothetical protein
MLTLHRWSFSSRLRTRGWAILAGQTVAEVIGLTTRTTASAACLPGPEYARVLPRNMLL